MGIEKANVEQMLQTVRFSGGIAASEVTGRFGGARFTRDTLEAMGHLLDTHPTLVRENFSLIPQEQGVDFDPLTDEQPDRMPHEVAYNVWDGVRIPAATTERRSRTAERWGIPFDEEKGFTVWNETDAGEYVHILKQYVDRYGTDVLGDRFIHRRTGEQRTVAEAALRLLDWEVRTIDTSDIGLVEVQEFNPKQTSWSGVTRDGYDSYFHEIDGVRISVNKEKPVAYLENQFIAMQMFQDALTLFGDSDDAATIVRVKRWKEMLQELPARTLEQFRWDEENIWVPAVDRDNEGRPRKVKIASSVIGETLLRPELYEALNRQIDTGHLIGSIATLLTSEEFLTPAGLRMLGKRHTASEGSVSAYQGARKRWPVVDWRCANGLEIAGLPGLAHDLRIKRSLAALSLDPDAFWENQPISDDGRVGYSLADEYQQGMQVILAEEKPAKRQTWTITGARQALDKMRAQGISAYPDLEKQLLKRSGEVAYPPTALKEEDYYVVDIESAKKIKTGT